MSGCLHGEVLAGAEVPGGVGVVGGTVPNDTLSPKIVQLAIRSLLSPTEYLHYNGQWHGVL